MIGFVCLVVLLAIAVISLGYMLSKKSMRDDNFYTRGRTEPWNKRLEK